MSQIRSKLYRGNRVFLATKHQKEDVIRPVFEQRLGCSIHVSSLYDTDQFGFHYAITNESVDFPFAPKGERKINALNGTALHLILFSLFLLIGIKSANSMESYDKYWSVAIITGSIPNNPSLKYYLEPQLRLIDDRYVFNQLLLLGGLGYQINKDMTVFLGPGWIIYKLPQGRESQEIRLWEQLNWLLVNTPRLNINSRTRLEERKDISVPQIAIRFRERIWMRVPFKNWDKYSFSCFNEIFLNLNHLQWVAPYFFDQNRAFIGISKQLSKSTIIDAGYLNQYIHSVKNRLDHVLLLSFTVNW